MLVRLHKDAFFRHYHTIGVLYQQYYNKTIVINESGVIFLKQLSRNPQSVDKIISSLVSCYKGMSYSQLKNDFMQFMETLSQLKMVVFGRTDIQEKQEEISHNHDVHSANFFMEEKRSTKDFLDEHFKKDPHLMSLQIEITPNCNLRCLHCYLGFGSGCQELKNPMDTTILCSVLDEFAALGGIHVSFTGGEALLNRDLPLLLRHARKNDLSITLLTNGTLLNEQVIQILKEVNVAKVQLSLYSLNPQHHDGITQVPGSCFRTQKAVLRLVQEKIPVQLACLVMKNNKDSFDSVIQFAHEHNLVVKVGSTIQALEDFSHINLTHRLNMQDTENFVRKYFANNPQYLKNIISLSFHCAKEDDLICGMGHYALNLDASGNYTPCAGFNLSLGVVGKNSLSDVFYNSPVMKKLRNVRMKNYPKCLQCSDRGYCDLCPGKLYSESGGDMFALSDYFCQTAHINRKVAEEFVASHKK